MRKIFVGYLFVMCFVVLGFKGGCEKKPNGQTQFPQTETSESRKIRLAILKAIPIELPEALPTFHYTTPKGISVSTYNAIPENAKEAAFSDMDEAITELLANTGKFGFVNARNFTDYEVLLKPATSQSEDGQCPTINMKDGVKVIGTVIGIGGELPKFMPNSIVVMPESFNVSQQCRRLNIDGLYNEGEHKIACANTDKWQKIFTRKQ